jgi:endonuclease/exonuclease/phosphatase family metal-dependent hydrolase
LAACDQHAQEYYPKRQRHDGSPFRGKPQKASALVCGDFNFTPQAEEYQAIQREPCETFGRLPAAPSRMRPPSVSMTAATTCRRWPATSSWSVVVELG